MYAENLAQTVVGGFRAYSNSVRLDENRVNKYTYILYVGAYASRAAATITLDRPFVTSLPPSPLPP